MKIKCPFCNKNQKKEPDGTTHYHVEVIFL